MAWFRKSKKDTLQGSLSRVALDRPIEDPETGQKYAAALIPLAEANSWWKANGNGENKMDLALRLWSKIRPEYAHRTSDADDESTTDVSGSPSMYGAGQVAEAYYDRVKLEQKRIAMYDDYARMDRECVLAKRALNVTVGNAYTSVEGDQDSYWVESEDSRIQSILEELDERVEMHQFSPRFCRSTLKFGDGFCEPVADAAGSVVRLKWLNQKYMYRNEDDYGRLIADAAFQMKDDAGNLYANFLYWQVIHLRWDHELGNRYGASTGFFSTLRRPWRRAEMATDSIVIKRIARSGKRYAYIITVAPGTSPAERKRIIEETKKEVRRSSMIDSSGNVDTRRRPALEENDIFLITDRGDDRTDVKLLDAGGMNDNYDDILLLRDDQVVSLGVPPAYLGLDKEVRGRAHLGWIDIEFARMIRSVQTMMAGFHRSVYDLQLRLLGMKGASDQYKVIFPPVSFVDEKMKVEVDAIRWDMAQVAHTMGIPMQFILAKVIGLDEKEVDEIMAMGIEPPQARQTVTADMETAREAYLRRMKTRAELADLRDRITAVIKGGYHKEVRI